MNYTHYRIKNRPSYSEMLKRLREDDDYKKLYKNMSVKKVNPNSPNYVITDLEGNKLTDFTLLDTYYLTKEKLEVNISFLDFVDILKMLIIREMSSENKELINNEEVFLNNNYAFLEGNTESVIDILRNLEHQYLRYETVCEILKDNFGLDISKSDHRLATFLTDLGYKKIRKRIEGKQQNVWVKTN